jgi:hypothetical protein
MKDDLRRLINEFIRETIDFRRETIDLQLTDKMKPSTKTIVREPTLSDFILWLNDEIED